MVYLSLYSSGQIQEIVSEGGDLVEVDSYTYKATAEILKISPQHFEILSLQLGSGFTLGEAAAWYQSILDSQEYRHMGDLSRAQIHLVRAALAAIESGDTLKVVNYLTAVDMLT
jgi:hypothetical protein